MTKIIRYNPFNPQVPALPEFFVGRNKELEEFQKNLIQTMHGSPMNMSITGNRGMGKTSILAKMEDLAKKNRCLVFRMSNYEGSVNDIPTLTDYLVLGIKQEMLSNSMLMEKIAGIGDWIKTLKPEFSYKEFSLKIEEKKIAAQSILRKNFVGIWNKVRDDYSMIAVLIDEAEALERVEGALEFLRETFQRLASEAKYSIVLSGKLNFTERMSESFSPLNRFFPTSALENFTETEISQYIDRKLSTVGVHCDEPVKREIFKKSEGHPYVVVSMCAHVFDQLKENENRLTESHYTMASPRILFQLEKDFFNPMFHPISPKAKKVIIKVAKSVKQKEFLFRDVVEAIGMKSSEVAPYIQEAVRKGILNKPRRANYHFFHGLFMEFVKSKNEDDF